MKTTHYALTLLQSNGKHFPLTLDHPTERRALEGKQWMEIGQGARDTYVVMPLRELKEIMEAGNLTLSAYTKEAQAEKIAFITAA